MRLKVLGLSVLLTGQLAAQDPIVSYNDFATLTGKAFGASSVGWYFTPTSSFFLTSISTRFSDGVNAADRTVTAELWSDRSALGGTLLRSADFQSSLAVGQFGGGVFDAVWLEAGKTYFIGFRNVGGLGRNTTEDEGSQSSGDLYFSRGDPSLGTYAELQGPSIVYNPSFQLGGNFDPSMPTTATPEPASMILMATGMIGMGVVTVVRRRRALRREQEASIDG